MRWVAFKFFWTIIWKHVALPCLEAMTDQARKSSQIYNFAKVSDSPRSDQHHAGTYPEPTLTVLGLDGVGVSKPVAEPSPESGGVVDTDSVDAA